MSEYFSIENVSKHFGKRVALDDVSFSVRAGEVLGLIGPNGAGKTTLFECLAGLLPADGGTLRSSEHILPPAHRKQSLFYLPDAIVPWPEQTVAWAINFFERLYGAAKSKTESLMEPLRLPEILKSRIGTLSKGERKRTLLALGLLTPHPLLLLDEPFDGLDLRQTRDVMKLLKQTLTKDRTLVLSIHQLTDAARVCDRLVLLSAGKVVGEGTIAELQERANLPDAGIEELFLALT